MQNIKVMQQALDPTGYGGVSVEFRALKHSMLAGKYTFVPLIIREFHRGISLRDILFYYREIRIERPDIVQIRGANVDGLNAVIAAKLAGNVKTMYCIHGLVSDNYYIKPWKKWIFRWIIEPMGFWLADGISCVYGSCGKRDIFKLFQKKMLPYVYNRMPDYSSVDKEAERSLFRQKYGIRDDEIVAVFCSRMSREKGLDYYADAINLLREHWPQKLKFVMVGDGDYLQAFQARLHPQISDCVIFTGSMQNVVPPLAAADFFVMPSLHENHSIALLEALAMKLPCIATDVGGNSETLADGRYGRLIPAFDSELLALSITEMSEETVRTQYRKKIEQADFEKFSNGAVDSQLDSAYCSLLRNSRKRKESKNG